MGRRRCSWEVDGSREHRGRRNEKKGERARRIMEREGIGRMEGTIGRRIKEESTERAIDVREDRGRRSRDERMG